MNIALSIARKIKFGILVAEDYVRDTMIVLPAPENISYWRKAAFLVVNGQFSRNRWVVCAANEAYPSESDVIRQASMATACSIMRLMELSYQKTTHAPLISPSGKPVYANWEIANLVRNSPTERLSSDETSLIQLFWERASYWRIPRRAPQPYNYLDDSIPEKLVPGS